MLNVNVVSGFFILVMADVAVAADSFESPALLTNPVTASLYHSLFFVLKVKELKLTVTLLFGDLRHFPSLWN